MSISQMLLPEFDEEMANTRKLLAVLPEGKMDYKPHEKSMTMGRLAGHVAELPMWATMTLSTESLNLTPDFKSLAVTTRDEALAALDQNVASARALIAAALDEDLMKPWTLSFQGQPMLTMPRIAVLRGMVMNHLIHHRAQLGVYLRMNDVAIPGLYGPSADEPSMFAQRA